MDTITQGLLGAVTAQLGFRQRMGAEATWLAGTAAIGPDLDFFIEPFLSLTGVEEGYFGSVLEHRGISHSLLMVPVLSLVVAFLWWRLRGWVIRSGPERPGGTAKMGAISFWWFYGCALAAVLSHPLLDWCTSYGTQLLSPFTNRRYAIDAVAIIDLIYSLILLVTLVSCLVVRMVKRNAVGATWKIGWVGFGLSVAYLACGYGLGHMAAGRMERFWEHKLDAGSSMGSIECRAYPQLGSIFVWRVVGRTPQRWLAGRVNIFYGYERQEPRWNETAVVENKWVRRAQEEEQVQWFDWFAMGQVRAEYRQVGDRHVVDFHDMRYGWPAESLTSLWSEQVVFGGDGELLSVDRVSHHRRGAAREIVGEAFGGVMRP